MELGAVLQFNQKIRFENVCTKRIYVSLSIISNILRILQMDVDCGCGSNRLGDLLILPKCVIKTMGIQIDPNGSSMEQQLISFHSIFFFATQKNFLL